MKQKHFFLNVFHRAATLLVILFLTFSTTACLRRPPSLAQKLQAQGVRIIHVGETIRLVFSSDTLFMPESANIQTCQYPVLDNVARFLRRYEKVVVIVGAYKNPSMDPRYDTALTRQQANNVVTYLWNRNVDARMMEGVGYGGICRISNQCSMNRRLEIVFHYIPDYLHEMNSPS